MNHPRGKAGRETCHVLLSPLTKTTSGTKRPRIPTFVDPFRFRTFLSNYRPTVSDCPAVNKYRDP